MGAIIQNFRLTCLLLLNLYASHTTSVYLPQLEKLEIESLSALDCKNWESLSALDCKNWKSTAFLQFWQEKLEFLALW